METFDYAAFDQAGKRLTGSITAETERDARDMLRAQALTPVDVKAGKSGARARLDRPRKPGRRDITQSTRQLAILIDAATPIEEALRVTAMQFEGSSMRQVLLDVRSRVLEGEKFSDALKAHSAVFPELFTSMVSAGETSGRLPQVLERLASDYEAAQKIRRKILAATAYPIVLSAVALIVVTVLMVFIVPRVVEQFDTFGQDLPGLTKFVIAASEWFKAWGLIALGAIIVAGFAWHRALKRKSVRLKWHGFVLSLPFIGGLVRDLNAARFSRTIAGLLDSSTPTLTAMNTARYTVRNAVIRDAVTQAGHRVREGAAMSTALRQTGVFPPLVVQMVAGGEASGNIARMFGKSADYLEGELDGKIAIFLNLLEPLIIILMSLVVLLIIGAIFLPILQLNTMAF